MRPKILQFLFLFLLMNQTLSLLAAGTWIWYPGDYEIWLGNEMNNRRTERGAFFPPFWKIDSHYVLVDFHKKFDLTVPEEVDIRVEGKYVVKIDGKMLPGEPKRFTVPAGKHQINVKIYHTSSPPTLFIQGTHVFTDNDWLVTFEDKEWIDASGKVSDTSATEWVRAGSWNFDNLDSYPSRFRLSTTPQEHASSKVINGGVLYDFGRETFGYLRFHNLAGSGKLNLYYGESEEEALDTERCETLDYLTIDRQATGDHTTEGSRAFRYVFVKKDPSIAFDRLSMLYEYLPLDYRGAFRCNDEEINRIWDVSAYTMHLTSREFFLDGIKRDRWVWSGDASQSYLMNYYLFFDSPSVARTMHLLRGKDPVTSHLNTIMDYSFYWFISIYDYYLYTGDKQLIETLYPRMKSLMSYCLNRRNPYGMVEGLTGDWVFIDWADGFLPKNGEVSFEQILLCRGLETMAVCADLCGNGEDQKNYTSLAKDLKQKIFDRFWCPEKGALLHHAVDGKPAEVITRYANMFAIFFDYLTEEQKQQVKQNVLLNDEILKITTPYMRFYELEALCAMGDQSFVTREMKDYWGGMLRLGATSFWEKYDPAQSGIQHLEMYARPYGKSLCHAWGASPIYLLGKYYLGVRPTAAGYHTYEVEPNLGGLKWMEGKVPTPKGSIDLYVSPTEIRIAGGEGTGTLRFTSRSTPKCKELAAVKSLGDNRYEIVVQPRQKLTIRYRAL